MLPGWTHLDFCCDTQMIGTESDHESNDTTCLVSLVICNQKKPKVMATKTGMVTLTAEDKYKVTDKRYIDGWIHKGKF